MGNNYQHFKAKFRPHKNQQLQADYIITSDGKNIGDAIQKYQFGFKNGCSTLQSLTILTTNIPTNNIIGNRSAELFLDICKAFA